MDLKNINRRIVFPRVERAWGVDKKRAVYPELKLTLQ